MPMSHNGLTKLIEECAEVIQIAAKMQAYPHTDDHPDGKGSMRQRLMDEIADVTAASWFVVETLSLNEREIFDRAGMKLSRFRKWSQEETK